MPKRRGKRSKSGLFGLALLLLLLLLLLPLSGFLAGVLPGGGYLESEPAPAEVREPGTLDVVVLRSAEGRPVAGASITVNGLAATPSGPNGAARIEKLGSGPVLIEAKLGEETAREWIDPSLAGTVELQLQRPPSRSGRAPDGARALLLDRDGRVLAQQEVRGGRYELPAHPEARSVCIQDGESAPRVVRDGDVSATPQQGDVEAEGKIEGLFGEFDVFGDLAGDGNDTRLPFRTRFKADTDGRFSGRLPKGARAFGVTGDDQPFALDGSVRELPKLVALAGTVRTALGSPVHDAELEFRPMAADDRPVPMPPLVLRADDKGRFARERFAAVRYRVRVSGRDCATRVFEDVVASANLEFQLDAGYRVKGTVVDPAGRPVPAAHVLAEGLPSGAGDRPLIEDRADDAGRFLVRGLGGRFARVRVIAPGFVPTTIAQVAKNAELRVVLLPK